MHEKNISIRKRGKGVRNNSKTEMRTKLVITVAIKNESA